MPDYYIRTPDCEESSGPFDSSQLSVLAEAGKITENALYREENKEEWIPIAVNEQLKAEVFAKCETKEERRLRKREESFEKAAAISTNGMGIMMLLCAVALLGPHFTILNEAISTGTKSTLINYPIIVIGLFDCIMAVFLFVAFTDIYPFIRGRAMLTIGFGIYIGWTLGNPMVMIASTTAGFGILFATFPQNYFSMIISITLGIGGNAALAYLSITGLFTEFFNDIYFEIISPK